MSKGLDATVFNKTSTTEQKSVIEDKTPLRKYIGV